MLLYDVMPVEQLDDCLPGIRFFLQQAYDDGHLRQVFPIKQARSVPSEHFNAIGVVFITRYVIRNEVEPLGSC